MNNDNKFSANMIRKMFYLNDENVMYWYENEKYMRFSGPVNIITRPTKYKWILIDNKVHLYHKIWYKLVTGKNLYENEYVAFIDNDPENITLTNLEVRSV